MKKLLLGALIGASIVIPTSASAQEYQGCFWVDGNDRVIDLSHICSEPEVLEVSEVASDQSPIAIEFTEVQRIDQFYNISPRNAADFRRRSEFDRVARGTVRNVSDNAVLVNLILYEDIRRVSGEEQLIGSYSRSTGISNEADNSILLPGQSAEFALFFNGDYITTTYVDTSDGAYELRQTYPNTR